jgi:transposase
MNEALCHHVVRRHQEGASMRTIARELGIGRNTVRRILGQVDAARDGQAPSSALPPPSRRRGGILDPYEPILKELLERYPDITVTRMVEELRSRGFAGKYTTVRQRLRVLRPRKTPAPVIRFETGPGLQAQMDYGVYDIDFTREGRRRVYLFSYLLSYSRRQYLRFVDKMDLHATLCEHVHAFTYLGGVAATCLYDNFKVVVLRHDADGPLYNPKFLAFATHYGFKPWACQVRRPQTKGKVERRFYFVETNLLNGRSFESLAHLNEMTAWWLQSVADVQPLKSQGETPLERHARERPHLIGLPLAPYDTALVVYRHVNAEGFLAYRLNFYSVPWSYIGQILPMRITEREVVIYSPTLEEIVRHPLAPVSVTGLRQEHSSHHPTGDPHERLVLLQQRFDQLGPIARRFLDGLLAKQVQGKHQAQQLLALFAHYQREDVLAVLERAVRFGAFALAAVQRILTATARPRDLLDILAEDQRAELDPRLREDPIGPRPASVYQSLLLPENDPHGTPSPETPSVRPSSRAPSAGLPTDAVPDTSEPGESA